MSSVISDAPTIRIHILIISSLLNRESISHLALELNSDFVLNVEGGTSAYFRSQTPYLI